MVTIGGVLVLTVSSVLMMSVVSIVTVGSVVGYEHLDLGTFTRRRAQHGSGNCTPNREQYRKDHQKPDAKEFHRRKVTNKPERPRTPC